MTDPTHNTLAAVQMMLFYTVFEDAMFSDRHGRELTRARLERVEDYLIRRACR